MDQLAVGALMVKGQWKILVVSFFFVFNYGKGCWLRFRTYSNGSVHMFLGLVSPL